MKVNSARIVEIQVSASPAPHFTRVTGIRRFVLFPAFRFQVRRSAGGSISPAGCGRSNNTGLSAEHQYRMALTAAIAIAFFFIWFFRTYSTTTMALICLPGLRRWA